MPAISGQDAHQPPLNQKPPLPIRSRPIVCIGAGGIVRDAHLPAYHLAGFSVAAVHDLDVSKAAALARDFHIPKVCESLEEAVAESPADSVFDLALPASEILTVLGGLPDGAPVLIQKPMGQNLEQARAIRELCRGKNLVAAVNLQLRFAPYVLASRDIVARGWIGEIHDIEIRLTCHMPWNLWPFLCGLPRMEINYHSIHYIDLIRSFLGEPAAVWCQTVKHPAMPELASTKTTLALDYGGFRRAVITTNHGHNFGPRHQESYFKIEGAQGAVKARLGVNLDYPKGLPDELEYCRPDEAGKFEWRQVPIHGSWFPHAFMGTMASVMRRANNETTELPTSVDDAFRTMAIIEACYTSSQCGATPVPIPDGSP